MFLSLALSLQSVKTYPWVRIRTTKQAHKQSWRVWHLGSPRAPAGQHGLVFAVGVSVARAEPAVPETSSGFPRASAFQPGKDISMKRRCHRDRGRCEKSQRGFRK